MEVQELKDFDSLSNKSNEDIKTENMDDHNQVPSENKNSKAAEVEELIIERKQSLSTDQNVFEGISEETLMIWESILINSNNDLTCHLVYDDTEILNVELDELNQKVIKNDCNRTRVKDKDLLPNFRSYIESFLTHYCKVNSIHYKQGLNEVLAPFLLLKGKFNVSLSRVYNLFSCFVGRFLTNFYSEEDFFSLQSALGLLSILLKYHDPLLFHLLEYATITPEMYATSWLLTFFSR